MLLEICCFNLHSALIAQEQGAQRIELCADAMAGGTTPAYGTIEMARRHLSIPIYTIVRPREGDFHYDENEFRSMRQDIAICKKLGCDGIVTGILQKDGGIDKERMSALIADAYPMGVTFHRAFDWTSEPYQALEDIISLGCERILTSGQMPDALSGANLIADLVAKADHRIIIMPGSGIRASNIGELATRTQAEEFHSSARIKNRSTMEFQKPSMAEAQDYFIPDGGEIKGMLTALNAFR
jgi:copper homeostasis protein